MELSINPERNHYKPILIVWLGSLPDEFERKRMTQIAKNIHTPIRIVLFCGGEIHEAYNQSINYCMEEKINYVIFAHKSIYPKQDWSEMLRGQSYKRHSIINKGHEFVILNVKKVRKYSLYQIKGKFGDLYKWLVEKSKSEGNVNRAINEIELNSIGDFNDTNKRQIQREPKKHSGDKGKRKNTKTKRVSNNRIGKSD